MSPPVQSGSGSTEALALEFCHHIIEGNFDAAASLISSHSCKVHSSKSLRRSFLKMSEGSEFDRCVMIKRMRDWPSKSMNETDWFYISLEGEQVEGLTLTAGFESERPVICSVEWGRP